MSNAVDQMGCIRHRETARYFTYYEDYQELSKQHPDKLAAFLRVLEVKTNKKLIAFEAILEDAVLNGKDIPELNLWLEISYNDFVYWSLKTMGRSSFQVADKEAEKMLLAKSRVMHRPIRPDDPDSPKVQYKEYLFILENVQAIIDGKELPITGQAYEDYGNTPPVFKNIPLLKKTWDMLQETRDSLLKKTYPPVEKNRLINKYISNPLKESEEKTTTDAHASSQSQPTPEKKSDGNMKPARERKPAAPRTPKQTPPPVVNEPDLSHLSEQEQAIYATLRQKDQPIYLAWPQTKRTVYNNWLGSFGYGMSVDITDGILSAVKRFEPIQPTIEDFKSIRKYAIAQEQDRPEDKRYYKKRGFKMWDATREYPNWKSQQEMNGQTDEGAPKNNQQMTRDELIAKALSFPTGLSHTSRQYQELQNCLMYLQPDDRKEVTRQRIAKQVQQQKKQVSA